MSRAYFNDYEYHKIERIFDRAQEHHRHFNASGKTDALVLSMARLNAWRCRAAIEDYLKRQRQSQADYKYVFYHTYQRMFKVIAKLIDMGLLEGNL